MLIPFISFSAGGESVIVDFHVHPYINNGAGKNFSVKDYWTLEFCRYALKYLRLEAGARKVCSYLESRLKPRGINFCVLSAAELRLIDMIKAIVDLRPDLFMGFCTVDPHSPDVDVQLARRVKLDGFRGLKVHSLMQSFRPPDVPKLWEAVSKLKITVLAHGGKIWVNDPDYANPAYYNEVLDTYPFTLVVAHMGGNYTREAVELAKKFDSVYLETSGATKKRIMYALERLGCERIVYGSDVPYIPWGDPINEIEKIKSLPIKEGEKERILGENAREILRLK